MTPPNTIAIEAAKEALVKTIRKSLTENWNDLTTGAKWDQDVLLAGCLAVKYSNPEHAAANHANMLADKILSLPALSKSTERDAALEVKNASDIFTLADNEFSAREDITPWAKANLSEATEMLYRRAFLAGYVERALRSARIQIENGEREKALEEYEKARSARDRAGYFGTVAECIEFLDVQCRSFEAEIKRLSALRSTAVQTKDLSQVDNMQRRGAYADIIEEALQSYHDFYMDDDFGYKNALDKICGKIRERYEFYKAGELLASAPKEPGKDVIERAERIIEAQDRDFCFVHDSEIRKILRALAAASLLRSDKE